MSLIQVTRSRGEFMKIVVISGSHRLKSESQRVSEYILGELSKLGISSNFLVSLADNPLPLWDEGVWGGDPKWQELWSPISRELQAADGFVVVSPEWGGMVPAGLKNFFLLCSTADVGHKPALIVSISSGIGGTYPVAELRASSYKNSRICYIPEQVIIRQSNEMLRGERPASSHDEQVRNRINFSLKLLLEYSKALKQVRSSGVVDYKSFPYGM